MSVFLTPDGRPFYGGTYFPDEPRHGMPSFRQVLEGVERAWREQRAEVEAAGGRLVQGLVEQGRLEAGHGRSRRRRCSTRRRPGSRRAFDTANGGWGRAPKFPQPMTIEFLLRRHVATGDAAAARRRPALARRDGRRRDARPARWRLPPLLDRCALARAALRADALRQRAARAGLPARLGADRRRALSRGRRPGRSTTWSAS